MAIPGTHRNCGWHICHETGGHYHFCPDYGSAICHLTLLILHNPGVSWSLSLKSWEEWISSIDLCDWLIYVIDWSMWLIDLCDWLIYVIDWLIDWLIEQWPLTQYCHLATYIWVNIGSGNGLLSDSTTLLSEPMLTNHQWGLVPFTWRQYLSMICMMLKSLI